MASSNGYPDREALRRRLIEQTEESEQHYNAPDRVNGELLKRRGRLSDIFMLLTLVTVFSLALLFNLHNYGYTTYAYDRMTTVSGSQTARLYPFCEGNLILENDALTYLVDGKTQFTTSVSVKNPVLAFRGGYFSFYDRGGYQIHICDATGILSSVRVSRKILGMDISENGVAAVFTESNDAAYISYFDRYGNRLPIEVKTVLDASGYPVKISISPDGQKLIALYFTTANGIGESRLNFYDFENGKEESGYAVASFDDYYGTNTFLVDAKFIDNNHAVVVGDNLLSFLSYSEKHTVSETRLPLSDDVRSVCFTDRRLLTVEAEGRESRCTVYGADGEILSFFNGPADYDTLIANDHYLVFGDREKLLYYNMSGKKRYEGSLVEAPLSMAFSEERCILVNTGSMINKITFK